MVEMAASASLGRLGNAHPEILDALRGVARDDPVEWVRRMAERSLVELNAR